MELSKKERYVVDLLNAYGNASLPRKWFSRHSIEEVEELLTNECKFKVRVEKKIMGSSYSNFRYMDSKGKRDLIYIAYKE